MSNHQILDTQDFENRQTVSCRCGKKDGRKEGSKDRRDPAKIVFSPWAGIHKLILTTRAQVLSPDKDGESIRHLKPGYLDKHMYTLV